MHTGELARNEDKFILSGQPFQILAILMERPGELVTREELKKRLWPSGTFVDFDHSLNKAVNRLREALDDSAEHPRFIETLPRRGYRFIAVVESPAWTAPETITADSQTSALATATVVTPIPQKRHRLGYVLALAGALLLAILIPLAMRSVSKRHSQPNEVPAIRSLAVLPLTNLSGDAEQDYFADGMTEEVITNLAKIGSVRVISRTSAMHYKRTQEPVPQIARALNVDAVIEGTVARFGDRVRITVNLVQAFPEKHLWAETYTRDLRDVLALQDEIALDISQKIRVQLMPQEHARLASARRVDPQAYELYLRGRYQLHRMYVLNTDTVASPRRLKSREYFDQAIAKDPSYAPAYVGLATTYVREAIFGRPNLEEAWSKAEAAAERAVEMDETLAEARVQIAEIRLKRDWNWAAAEKEYNRALQLNPNYADAHSYYAYYLNCVGRPDQAIRESKRAVELDPLRADLWTDLGYQLVFAGKDDEAIDQFRRSLELEPNAPVTRYGLALSYESTGMYKQAAAERIEYLNLMKDSSAATFKDIYKAKGYQGAVRFFDQHEIEDEKRQPHPDGWTLAYTYARLGDKDEAFKWLEKLYEEHSATLIQIKVDSDLDSLHSDPRYANLLRRIGFPP